MIDGSPFLYAGNGRRFMDEILIKAGGFLFMIALGFVLKRIGLFSLDDSPDQIIDTFDKIFK